MTTRHTAQERVVASVSKVSADLLVVETAQQAEVARWFARTVPVVAPRSVLAFRNSAATKAALSASHRRAMAEAETVVARVVRRAAREGSTSIERELRALERSLPASDRGATVTAMRTFDAAPVVARALALTVAMLAGLQDRWEAAVRDAGSRSKTPEQVTGLLVGRARPQGAWWASSTSVQAHIRWVSIATVNAVRQGAMSEFNAA